jgi:hypothetical protein
VSYENRTLAEQQTALAALTQIGAAFGDLPAPEFRVSRVYPDQVSISLHDNLADFEAWREALGMAVGAVEYRTQPGNTVLKVVVPWGGGTVELVGYGPLPLRDVERGGAS